MNKPQYINFVFEISEGVLPEQEEQAKLSFNKAGIVLEAEWNVSTPIAIRVSILSGKAFREDATSGPQSWKYCFLLRDQPDDKIYCNVDVFRVLPNDAEKIIKHETAHIVVAHLVGNFSAYKNSFFLEEGTAGFDDATNRLSEKLRKENIRDIPDPLAIKTIGDIKTMGGDTNKEPFADQLGYLVLFSFVGHLRKVYGENKIIGLYKMMGVSNFEQAFTLIYKEPLSKMIAEWRKNLPQKLD